MKIDSWKVILTTDDGKNIELDEIPEDISAQIDDIIEETYPTTWKGGI